MLHYDQEAIARFCADHRAAITGLFRQAYAAVGGHYAPLPPGALALEAEIDAQAFVTDLARGGVDVAAVRQAVLRAATDDVPGLKVLGDRDLVIAQDSTGVVAPRSGRTVVTLGLDDVVVVDTPDALLVTTRERAQDVKSVVDILHRSGRTDLT